MEKSALKERIHQESARLLALDEDLDGEQIEEIKRSLEQLWAEYKPGTAPPAALLRVVDSNNADTNERKIEIDPNDKNDADRGSSRRSSRSPSRRSSRSPSKRISRSSSKRGAKKFRDVLSQAAKSYLEKLDENEEDGKDEDADSDLNESEYDDDFELSDDEKFSIYTRYRPPPIRERNPRNRPMSFVDKKIKSVQESRLELMKQKEALIKKRLDDRIEKRKENAERQRLQALQTSWLLIIAHFSRLNVMKNIVEQHRQELAKWAHASRDKKAVRDIEIWWPKQYIVFKLYKKYPFSRYALATLFMNRWRKKRIAQNNDAQALIRQFVGDVTGLGETMRKIYLFRIKVKRVQEWVRMYFNIYFARLQVLWKILQREEDKLKRIVAKGMEIKVRKARNCVIKIKGFGQKANLIEKVSTNISSLLKFQEEMDGRRKIKAQTDAGKHKSEGKVVSRMRQWQSEVITIEDGVEKMEFLMELLERLRHANVVKNDASKHRTIGKGPRSDESDAKVFLSDSEVSMPKLAATLAELEDPTIKRSKRHPFYMITGNGGALDEIREWADKYYKRRYYDEFMLVEEEARNPTPVEPKRMNMF